MSTRQTTLALSCLVLGLVAAPTTAWAPILPHTTRSRGESVSLKFIDHVQTTLDPMETSFTTRDGLTIPVRSNIKLTPPPPPSVHKKTAPSDSTLIALGCVLAANSGFLNGLTLSGLLGPNMACAAVTGAWTNGALKLGAGNMGGFAAQAAIILAYIAGSFANGVAHPQGVTDWDSTHHKPSTTRALLCVAALVACGSSLHSVPLLAMANGWQNSWTSMLLKGNVIRSTHFSGVTSDLGTMMGQMLRMKSNSPDRAKLLWKVTTQLKIVFSFFLGGLASVACTNVWGSAKTGIVASIAVYLACFGALRWRPNWKAGLRSVRPALRKPIRQVTEPMFAVNKPMNFSAAL